MNTKNQKITLTQGLIMYLVVIYTGNMRYITSATSATAHQAAWLSVPASMLFFIPFLIMLITMGKKFAGQPLHDILCRVFGKAVGKIICAVYLLWLLILLALYFKYSAENLAITAFIGTDINLLLLISAIIAGVTLRWGIAVVARMNRLFSVFIFLQLLVILFFLFLHFRPESVTPISQLDIMPILASTLYPLTVFVYITPLLIFNDQIMYAKNNKGKIAMTAGYLTISNVLLMLALVGMLGYPLISQLRLPLFTAVETISVFNSSAGLESLFISIWMLAEYITRTFFAYCISRLLKNMFGLKSEIPALTAVLAFAIILAIFLSNDTFELISFSRYIMSYFNVFMGLIVPFIIFTAAKIRKMI